MVNWNVMLQWQVHLFLFHPRLYSDEKNNGLTSSLSSVNFVSLCPVPVSIQTPNSKEKRKWQHMFLSVFF